MEKAVKAEPSTLALYSTQATPLVFSGQQEWHQITDLATHYLETIMPSIATQNKEAEAPTSNGQTATAHSRRVKPQITEIWREDEKVLPETIYLEAIDPSIPQSPDKRIIVELENHDTGADLELDLMTNNDRFTFVCNVVRGHFKKHVHIVGSYVPSEPF